VRPDWDDYFIEIAKVVSSRSTCLRRKYGAVIVKDRVMISSGYNGAPRGIDNCIDLGKCVRKELNVPSGERYELCEAVHASRQAPTQERVGIESLDLGREVGLVPRSIKGLDGRDAGHPGHRALPAALNIVAERAETAHPGDDNRRTRHVLLLRET